MNRVNLLILAVVLLAVFTSCLAESQVQTTPQTSIWTPSNSVFIPPATSSVRTVVFPTSTYTEIAITKPVPPEGVFCEQNISYVIKSGLTITMDSMYVIAHGSYYELNIDYRIENTTDKILEEEIFKAYFADSSGEIQTGLFGRIEPGQTISKSYVWQATRDKAITMIEFEADYSNSFPGSNTPKWKPPKS